MIAREKTQLPSDVSLVKIVVDIERKVASFGSELHTDCYEELMKDGSSPKNLWGANILTKNKTIEFVSMINIRPADGNRGMEIKNSEIRNAVEAVIKNLFSFAQNTSPLCGEDGWASEE